MEKKISLDLAQQNYYIKIPSAQHEPIFSSVFAMDYFLQLLNKHNNIRLRGYSFFPDSINLLIYSETSPSYWLDQLLMEYNQWHQTLNNKTGYLFDDDHKIQMLIQPKYLIKTLRLIQNLPVINKLCSLSEQYLYSSYHDYTGKQKTGVQTDTILGLLSPHYAQRKNRFNYYMLNNNHENLDWLESTCHKYYLALSDHTYLTHAMSRYDNKLNTDLESTHHALWNSCIEKLSDITQLENKTLLGINRHHSLPDAPYLLAWLFVTIAQGPPNYAAKHLSLDKTTLLLNIKSITLHHPSTYLRYIANAWQQTHAA